jgi:hypothetical protein
MLFMALLIACSPQHSPARAWSKGGLALVLCVPAIWWSFHNAVWRELIALPDDDVPAAWNARILGDLKQTQLAICAIYLVVIACAAVAGRIVISAWQPPTTDAGPTHRSPAAAPD